MAQLLKKLFSKKAKDISKGSHSVSRTCQIPYLEKYFEKHFGLERIGCFVEVGAYDGETFSNTSWLADKGWTGYYIEPVPYLYELCKERHRKNEKITVSRYAIGADEKEVTIFVGGALSTALEETKERIGRLEWAKGCFEGESICAKQITLEKYLKEMGIEPGFDLLVIDVEGMEWEVLRNWDIRYWKPKMVIVELTDQHPDFVFTNEASNKIIEYFDRYGYKLIFKDIINTIYILPNACGVNV